MTGPAVERNRFAELAREVTIANAEVAQIEVRTPATGELVALIPAGTDADVERAIVLARAAQRDWSASSPTERKRIFLRFHDLLLSRQEEILDLIQLESGKSRANAFEEVLDTAGVARYYSRRANKLLRPRRRRGAMPFFTSTWELRIPVGVVGFITPWNFPLTLGITDAIAALMAGNGVVLKPDPQTSLTALWGRRLLQEAGLPRDLFCIVTGEGPSAGQALVDRADYVMFTGSNEAGKLIAARCAARLAGCSVELGGKNPMIVLDGADPEETAEGAVRACFAGAGQVCVSIERIYVHESVYAEFLDRFANRTRQLKLGAALDYSMDVGSVTTAAQLRKIEDHVADALVKGATLVAGGKRRPDLGPLFFEPTILTGVRPGMALFEEETFGPVVAVYPIRDELEGIERANATPYGLSASIWTRDIERGIRVASAIEAGSVNVNEGYSAAWASVDSPIGGMKQSGLRPRHGAEGILKFTETQTIAAQRWLPIAPSHGMSQEFYARWMTRLVKMMRWLPWM